MFAKGWYAILPIKQLPHTHKLLPIKVFGQNLVIWRNTQQQLIVMHDECPHRNAKLSLGKIVNDCIACPFHGFQYNNHGECTHAPEFNRGLPGLKVKIFPHQIAVDMLWVYYGDNVQPLHIQPLVDIHNSFNANYSITTAIWNASITRCIENQLDYTHLPHVHATTIGRGRNKFPEERNIIHDTHGIKILTKKSDTLQLEYIMPNAWILYPITKLRLIVYFVPISGEQTQFYLLGYQKFIKNKLLKPLANIILNYTNLKILRQDQQIVESQTNNLINKDLNEHLLLHDTPISLFRQLWHNNC